MANRPSSVSPNATLIYPGQTYGPGVGVQQATIAQINAIIARANSNLMFHYANGYRDWSTNAQIYHDMGLPVGPPPPAPHCTKLSVVYADQGGDVVDPPEGADGLHYAWVEEVPA